MNKFWNFRTFQDSKGKKDAMAELYLYGPISEESWFGDEVTPKQFIQDLKDAGDVNDLHIRINSGGGDVFAATAIYNLLKAHKAHKTVFVDGLAASAASVIAMAGDTIKMPSNAIMMIHDPWTMAMGNEKDLQQSIEILQKVKDTIIASYQNKTGKTYDELHKLMSAETWMTGKEAVEMGFADELLNEVKVAASVGGDPKSMIFNGLTFDMSLYQKGDSVINKISEKKGDDPMKLNEILASLSEEQRNVVNLSIEEIKVAAQKEFDDEKVTLNAEIETLKAKIPTEPPKEDTEADILAKANPKIVEMLNQAKRMEAEAKVTAAEAMNKLQKIEDEATLSSFKAIAASYDRLPVDAEVYGPIFMSFAKANKEGFEVLQGLLKVANTAIEKGKLFDSIGNKNAEGAANAWDTVQIKMVELKAINAKLSDAEAMAQVFHDEPKLYEQYKNEQFSDEASENE